MTKLKMHTPNATDANITRIAELFPNCVTEAKDEKGIVKRAIDFDQLRQELSDHVVDGSRERYHLDWPGKREALLAANAPIAKTLRPYRDESVDFDTTKNLFIEGDNLDALKLLQETYLNKVKMIYIDPPYNTGQEFIYDDDFKVDTDTYFHRSSQEDDIGNRMVANTEANGRFHSDWLTMMYSRLKLSRDLLSEDGMIFISIDDNEVTNLSKMCDEIFGRDNCVGTVVWKNKYGAGAKTRTYIEVHEYILCYSKTQVADVQSSLTDEQISEFEKHKDEQYNDRGGYITQPLMTKSLDDRKTLQYDIVYQGDTITPRKQWVWSRDRLEAAIRKNEVVFKKQVDGTYSVRSKVYLKDERGVTRKGKPLSLINGPFNQEGTSEVEEILGASIFSFPKPVSLIRKFVDFTVNGNEAKDGIYLDFFSGSATAAHAVMAVNAQDGGTRRYIMVQMPEECADKSEAFKAGYKTIAEIGKERIRRAGKSIKEQCATTAPNLDIGFRVLKVDTSNMKDVYYQPDAVTQPTLLGLVDNIKEDRTDEDLLFQVLLDWGVDLTLPITPEKVKDMTVYFVDTNALAACFETGIDEAFIKELAKRKPLRAVFRDTGFGTDATKINVEQIFKLLSPATEVKSI